LTYHLRGVYTPKPVWHYVKNRVLPKRISVAKKHLSRVKFWKGEHTDIGKLMGFRKLKNKVLFFCINFVCLELCKDGLLIFKVIIIYKYRMGLLP
jgi:hypothetical protein